MKSFKVSELFTVKYGNSKITNAYIRERPGPYPVYSATVDPHKVAGSIDHFDHEGECLSFVRIGYAGHVILRSGKFSVTCNVLLLVPKPDVRSKLHLPYFVSVITDAFKEVARGRFKEDGTQDYTQITQSVAREVQIDVPFTEGDIDYEKQKALSEKVETIAAAKARLSEISKRVDGLEFEFSVNDGGASAEFRLGRLFDTIRGKSSYTRSYAVTNPGVHPLYTAATRQVNPNRISRWDHDLEALHYTAQGAYAGTVFHRQRHKFSMTGDAGILVRRSTDILYRYAFYEVRRVFNDQGFCWASNTASKGKIEQLALTFPVDPHGSLDVERQNAIADRHEKLCSARLEVSTALRRLGQAKVILTA